MKIFSILHIQIAINRALYNKFVVKKFKFDSLKKEILYYTNERNRLENCLDLHKINENSRIYFVLFINFNKENVKDHFLFFNV